MTRRPVWPSPAVMRILREDLPAPALWLDFEARLALAIPVAVPRFGGMFKNQGRGVEFVALFLVRDGGELLEGTAGPYGEHIIDSVVEAGKGVEGGVCHTRRRAASLRAVLRSSREQDIEDLA